jgi:hypothetical protein
MSLNDDSKKPKIVSEAELETSKIQKVQTIQNIKLETAKFRRRNLQPNWLHVKQSLRSTCQRSKHAKEL